MDRQIAPEDIFINYFKEIDLSSLKMNLNFMHITFTKKFLW